MKGLKCIKLALAALSLCMVLALSAGATNLTIFQISDTHYIGGMICNGSRATINCMNNMPGMAWPYGYISTPTAVIMCGDLCDGGDEWTTPATDTPQWYSNRNYQNQWNGFIFNFPRYGVAGNNNRLEYRNYVVPGNHDWWRWCGYTLGTSQYVCSAIETLYSGDCNTTNGNNYYSFNLDGIHFCAIGRYPDSYVLSWLASDLATVGTSTPVILFLHYDFKGSDEWWTAAQRTALYNVINGYRIIGILHGHTHDSAHYTWNGYDVYDDGSATYFGGINVIKITDTTVQAAQYHAYCAGGDPADTSGGYWDGTGYWEWNCSKTY